MFQIIGTQASLSSDIIILNSVIQTQTSYWNIPRSLSSIDGKIFTFLILG